MINNIFKSRFVVREIQDYFKKNRDENPELFDRYINELQFLGTQLAQVQDLSFKLSSVFKADEELRGLKHDS